MNGDPNVGANWRRGLAFVAGLLILVFELEWRSQTRWAVVAVAAILMGVVSVDQLMSWGVLDRWLHPAKKDYGDKPTAGGTQPGDDGTRGKSQAGP